MLDRPTLDHSKLPQPVTSPVEDPAPSTHVASEPAPPEPPDPWRQLFGRHNNHLDGSQARRLRSTLRLRLFARTDENR